MTSWKEALERNIEYPISIQVVPDIPIPCDQNFISRKIQDHYWFDPETKKVYDTAKNFIGYGEMDGETLVIKHRLLP